MTLLYFEDDIYKAKNSYYDREVLKSSGFRWNPAEKVWETNNVDSLKEACEILHDAEMDDAVRAIIDEPIPEIEPHRVEPADAPAPAGLSFHSNNNVSHPMTSCITCSFFASIFSTSASNESTDTIHSLTTALFCPIL